MLRRASHVPEATVRVRIRRKDPALDRAALSCATELEIAPSRDQDRRAGRDHRGLVRGTEIRALDPLARGLDPIHDLLPDHRQRMVLQLKRRFFAAVINFFPIRIRSFLLTTLVFPAFSFLCPFSLLFAG